jgi:hypothetical protein
VTRPSRGDRPAEETVPYTELAVWQDEYGDEVYYLPGHHSQRRAIAATNRDARVNGGLVNLCDDPEARLAWVTVRHTWWREVDDEHMVLCLPTDPDAQAITEVTW